VQGLILATAFLIAEPPPSSNTSPTPQQMATAELSSTKSALENARTQIVSLQEEKRTEIARARSDTIWTFLITLGGAIGTILPSGALAAKWWIDKRIQQRADQHKQELESKSEEHKQDIARLQLEHTNAVEMARVQAETKKTSNDGDVELLRKDLKRLEERCAADEKECQERLKELKEAWIKADAKAESLRDRVDGQQKQLIHLQARSKDFPFASWACDRQYRILHVTGNADRNILYPMGMSREEIELKNEDEIWPKELVAILAFLREWAQKKPGHCAAVRGARFYPDLPAYTIAKIMGQSTDGAPWGLQTVLIPENAFVDLPPELVFADKLLESDGKPK
jgi:hypothetical protein